MQNKFAVLGLSLGVLLAVASGCAKKEEPPAPPPKPANSSAAQIQKSAEDMAAQATKAASQAGAEVGKAVGDAAKQAETAVKETAQKVQDALGGVSKFVSEKKYADALAKLKELSTLQLNPEQQRAVTALKAHVQQLMATGGAASPKP